MYAEVSILYIYCTNMHPSFTAHLSYRKRKKQRQRQEAILFACSLVVVLHTINLLPLVHYRTQQYHTLQMRRVVYHPFSFDHLTRNHLLLRLGNLNAGSFDKCDAEIVRLFTL